MPDTFTLVGLRELEQNVEALATEYGPRNAAGAYRTAMRRTLNPIRDDIKANTPIDTGGLAESTGIILGAPNRRLLRNPELRSVVFIGSVGWIWRSPTFTRFHQAVNVEFGNIYTRPTRVLRNAFTSLQQRVNAEFIPELTRQIERTATRLSRRRTAGTLRVR